MRTFVRTFWLMVSAVSTVGAAPFDYKFSIDQGGQHVDVVLELRPIDPKHHDLQRLNNQAIIDGKVPVGIGPGSFSAQTEFSRFEISWNGKRVEVPALLYTDLFNPSLIPKTNPVFDREGSVWTCVSSDGKQVLLEIEGGNDAVSYKAWIIISRDGKCSRFVTDTTP
jgi:hypothetical protein